MPPMTLSSAAADAALIRDLQMRVAALEAEIERMKMKEVAKSGGPASCAAAAGDKRHISSLSDDLLLEIFLRLPSLATLVRAACVCTAWRRAVASSPDFRRRFRALHPPPLLGLFTTERDSIIAGSPAFVPARPLDRDLAAVIRGGDFSLTSLLDNGGWIVISSSSRIGDLLLCDRDDKLIAAVNPLTRQPSPRRVPNLASRNTLGGHCFGAMLSSEDEAGLLMLVIHAGSKMKATIYSMDTGVCSAATPWVDVPACPAQDDGRMRYGSAVHLNGSVYYLLENWRYIVSIDTATMEFTVIELPPQCVSQSSFSRVGETDDGTTCLVYSDGHDVGVLMHARDADGVQKWVLDRVVSMDVELRRVLPAGQFDDQVVSVLRIFGVWDGYVFLSTSATVQAERYWFMSLCLRTMKLEKLFQRASECNGYPYIMPWPRSLFGS